MSTLIDREYCLKHPQTIIKLFGTEVYLKMMTSKKGLLENLTEYYAAHGYPMPGKVGDAYRLSSVLEYRMARIYKGFAEKFKDNSAAHELFSELQQEEEEHGRLMEICRYTVKTHPDLKYVPSVRDPAISEMLKELKQIAGSIEEMTLEEALDTTERLEQGEINTIFDRLLKQSGQSESDFFAEQMQHLEGHGTSVPKRIQELRGNPGASAS
jgi:hypothetical protein